MVVMNHSRIHFTTNSNCLVFVCLCQDRIGPAFHSRIQLMNHSVLIHPSIQIFRSSMQLCILDIQILWYMRNQTAASNTSLQLIVIKILASGVAPFGPGAEKTCCLSTLESLGSAQEYSLVQHLETMKQQLISLMVISSYIPISLMLLVSPCWLFNISTLIILANYPTCFRE